jgi:RNA polymerase sigma-70 factor, ECF subfamily
MAEIPAYPDSNIQSPDRNHYGNLQTGLNSFCDGTVLIQENAMITPLRLMQKKDDPEEELVLQAKAGSHAAFEALYRIHLGHVYGICMRILTDQSRAEDVTQKIFIQAWMKLQSFRGDSRFSSWLYRLSVNMILDHLKPVGWKNDASLGNEENRLIGTPSFEPAHNLRMDLNNAIDSLPRQARIIFVMHDIAGYTHEEIANAMKLASGTCKAQLSRARKILREMLKP